MISFVEVDNFSGISTLLSWFVTFVSGISTLLKKKAMHVMNLFDETIKDYSR